MPIGALVRFLLVCALLLGGFVPAKSATTILPPGATCFQQASGPVSSGSIYMLVPGTTTAKNTWQNSSQTILNTNPIQLDGNGCALIYGTGTYRQQVYTGPVVGGLPTGTLLYDVTTQDTSSYNAVFWAGLSGGTPNAITVTDAGFNNTDGSVINFLALNTNTGATTLNVSGGGAIAIETPSSSGPIAISSGCIATGNPVSVVYSSADNAWLLLTACQASSGPSGVSAVGTPGGYLTLSSDTNNVIITNDALSATTIYYTPYSSNQVQIWNGTSYSLFTFAQLQLALSSSQIANTIYDVCVFSNSGVATLVTGPAWSDSAGGAGSRGIGAGTAQISRINGLWVNSFQITGINGTNSYTIAANQCTIVGTILMDSTSGQISNYVSVGQNRKWGVWNFYNRLPITLQVADSTLTWTYASPTPTSANSTVGNAATAMTGLAEEPVYANYTQTTQNGTCNSCVSLVRSGIGFNTAGTFSGQIGDNGHDVGNISLALSQTINSNLLESPALGSNTYYAMQAGSANTPVWYGTVSGMLLSLRYRG